jgi:translocation and assembly module TamB
MPINGASRQSPHPARQDLRFQSFPVLLTWAIFGMSVGRHIRRVIIIIAWAVLGLLVLILSLPLWFPWVLRPVARHLGVTYGRYERQGYARCRVYNVSYSQGSTHVAIRRLEGPVPTIWLWRHATGETPSRFVVIEGWTYETLRGANKPSTSSTGHNYAGQLQNWARWLPTAGLTEGTVRSPSVTLVVPEAVWSRGALTGSLHYVAEDTAAPGAGIQVTFAARPIGPDAYQIQLRAPALHWLEQGQLSTTAAGVSIQSSNSWWGNPIELRAEFAPGKSQPETAQLYAPRVLLPPEATGLRHYGDLAGSVASKWQSGHFRLDLEAEAQPLPVSTNFPPLHLTLHATGDTKSATIEKATLVAPWLTAQLSRGLEVHFTGKLLRERAFLDVAADLERQPWFPAKGRLTGEAQFTPSWGKFPAVDFRLSGTEVGYRGFQTRELSLEGNLDWPKVLFSDVRTTLADGSIIQTAGRLDLIEKTVAEGRFHIVGPWLKRWLPTGYDFQSMEASGIAAGPFAALSHHGQLGVTNLSSRYLRPLDIKADWHGVGPNLTNAQAVASAGHSSLLLEGSFERTSTNAIVQLKEVSLGTNKEPVLTLIQPTQVQFTRAKVSNEWAFQTSALALQGKAGAVQGQAKVSWPKQGSFDLHLQGISSSFANDFIKTNAPPISVKALDATGGWSNGPMQFSVALDATIPQFNQKLSPGPLRFELESTANGSGVVSINLVVAGQSAEVLRAKGSLPLLLNPGALTNLVQIEPERPLQLEATIGPSAFVWDELAKVSGLGLVNPKFTADLSGTWAAPIGKISLRSSQIHLLRHTNEVSPDLRNLELVLEMDPGGARLTTGEIFVQGERVSFSGELPLGPESWTGLTRKQWPDWRQAQAHLRVEEAALATFEPLFPKLLAPQGDVSVNLWLLPGGNLEGEANVEHARTRPLGEMGPIRDVGINLRLHQHLITLKGATARIGGSTITMSGQSELPGTNWSKRELPPFELAIRGIGVPLARAPEFVLRSDLLLGITKTNGAPPLISGVANLRDSFYLTDLQDLIPGKVTTPERRPPYFSIHQPLLADWRLAVDVQGTRFLKVRSPLFNGEISANAKLQGTLQDPIVIGDIKIDSGAVRFPFASIPAQQGVITLSSQDPYHPQLSVIGASKQFGYDIRMEIAGPVDAPVIQFNSTPPLSSEQILLMITAGEMPQGTSSLSSQQRAQTVGLFLGRDLLSKLGVGDQAEERLIVHTGEEISEQGRPTYNVEYKLTDRWSVTGEYDRFGDFNAGLKWRIFSK